MDDSCSISRKRSFLGVTASAFMAVVGFALCSPDVAAHTMASKTEDSGKPNGIEIASIAHSDMAILAEFRPEIIALAERQFQTDERFRRLLNFSKIQYTYCLWGIVPGALSDEESDFNECSHAYLASAWALLKHMEGMPLARGESSALRQSIEAAMAAVPSLSLCANSADVFHTDRLVVPPQAYAAAGGLSGLLLLAGVVPFLWANRRAAG